MIKIFRNIRKTLIKEGKTTNYLKYAIGEIVLVVIGILIALQINNWNEYRKDRNDERMALIELYQSLRTEHEILIPGLVGRGKTSQHGINAFMDLREHNESISDSVFDKLWTEVNTGAYFSYEAGPFESIKNRGLNLITNDSLRTMLVQLYETKFPRIQNLTVNFLNKYEYTGQLTHIEEFLMETKPFKGYDGNWNFKTSFKSPDMLYSQELIEYLRMRTEMNKHFMSRMEQINPPIENALEALHKELYSFDHD